MGYTCINIFGNLLSEEILQKIETADPSIDGQKVGQFGLDEGTNLRSEIEYAWSKVKLDWDYHIFPKIRNLPANDPYGTSLSRRWCESVLSALGYTLVYQRNALTGENNQTYAISHIADNAQNMPIHIVGFYDPQKEAENRTYNTLDIRSSGGTSRRSPHATLQEYLNVTEHIYGITSNGFSLRLIRNSGKLVKLTYIDFDIRRMLEEDKYSEFTLLFRLLHASRFIPSEMEQCLMEQYFHVSIESGNRIRNGLSQAVKNSILALANGFANHPDNEELRIALREESFSEDGFYKELLRLIYRLLFLMVTEERDLVYDNSMLDAEGLRKKRIYFEYYSIVRLRRISRNRSLYEARYNDLWQGLLNTFRLYEAGGNGKALDIQALAGELFNSSALYWIGNCTIDNKLLLECVRNLNEFQDEKGNTVTVNYGALDVEEFGSVYEGLLEYNLTIIHAASGQYDVVFDDSKARSSSGSHYTPEQLVEPLIKHSLSYLIEDCVKPFYQNKVGKEETIRKLLNLKVCDIACGSGHILLSGARRIALELARVETGEEQPNPKAFRIAMRDVIKNCIYGVDLNPLAVELCKVALWLEAHIPGEPLSFLDHRIRCGNSVLGIAYRNELETGIANEVFDLSAVEGNDKTMTSLYKKRNTLERKKHEQQDTQLIIRFDKQVSDESLREALTEYHRLAQMPEHTAEEIELKQKSYNNYLNGKGYTFLSNLANLQLAQFFLAKNEENQKYLVTDADYRAMLSGHLALHGQKTGMANAIASQRRFFHWFLEFPEVFSQGGFDCILGNPPFLGGQKLSGTFGKDFLEYLKYAYAPIGAVDFVTYFFRRIFNIIRSDGFQSLISTNTIAQGSAREGGLDIICSQGGTINHAVRSMRWPGRAAVEVSLVTIRKGEWKNDIYLDGKKVERITPYLDNSEVLGNPYPLRQNAGKSFQGSIVLGKGFVVTKEQAATLIAKDPRNKGVLFPYLNGEDLNTNPDQSPSRWVINFFDWTEEKARTYPDCFEIVERLVKPERLEKNDKVGREKWWQFLRLRKEMYETISKVDQVMVLTRVSKYVVVSIVPSHVVFMEKVVVKKFQDLSFFSIMQSGLYEHWAWKYSSTLGSGTINYSPSTCFETFPFPQELSKENHLQLTKIGELYNVIILCNCGTANLSKSR